MTRPDDSLLSASQLATVRWHADKLLREASAHGRFPTPIDDLMDAAKLTIVDDEVLNESLLRQFVRKAKSGMVKVKTALSKVLGLFESHDRLVVIDKNTPKPRKLFIKLHEAGHGSLPHQSKIYRLIHDCEETLNAEITDLFEREANVFASEALFQGEVFAKEAQDLDFDIKTPIALARKFGASNYATFRRFVTTNRCACCVVVLEPPDYDSDGNLSSDVRRVVVSKSFATIFDGIELCASVSGDHPLVPVVPINGRRMTFGREILLRDRNGDERVCTAEAFNTTHQVLVLIRDVGLRRGSGIVIR